MNMDMKYVYSPQESLSDHRIKFLCSVGNQYELICPAPVIHYDPVTYLPGLVIDGLHQEYRADFLIRHRMARNAFLVELHPAFMMNDKRLRLRRKIAEKYIAKKGYDWQYQCLFQEYIQLDQTQSLLYDTYLQMATDDDRRKWLNNYFSVTDLFKSPGFLSAEYSLLDFLIHAILPGLY
jgi:hypothetical protein